jgi:hypothetical protein
VKRKRYSRKFQRMAVERMRSSDNLGDLAEELGVTRRWAGFYRSFREQHAVEEEMEVRSAIQRVFVRDESPRDVFLKKWRHGIENKTNLREQC